MFSNKIFTNEKLYSVEVIWGDFILFNNKHTLLCTET